MPVTVVLKRRRSGSRGGRGGYCLIDVHRFNESLQRGEVRIVVQNPKHADAFPKSADDGQESECLIPLEVDLPTTGDAGPTVVGNGFDLWICLPLPRIDDAQFPFVREVRLRIARTRT